MTPAATIRSLVVAVTVAAASMSACGVVRPQIECVDAAGLDCTVVFRATQAVVEINGADRVVIGWGRGRGFHAVATVCHPDGTYVLVDVIGDPMVPSIRSSRRGDQACARL